MSKKKMGFKVFGILSIKPKSQNFFSPPKLTEPYTFFSPLFSPFWGGIIFNFFIIGHVANDKRHS